jgi:hypothetical protein
LLNIYNSKFLPLKGYLGSDRTKWTEYDSTLLVQSHSSHEKFDDILIDVGTADSFYLSGQLLPEVFSCYKVKNIVQIMYLIKITRNFKMLVLLLDRI